ncbi:hypothetical protein JTB14_027772 [Gonioctena quinquepunctata]|nr:hypothetical protein JTB14_027772 [Gonioctena quinquepunctata]
MLEVADNRLVGRKISVFCPDNFFKKMTDLESPKKNNDCYFYYYSTCAKGDNCTFRHEPSALGCETMCSFWKEGKCLNVHCNFRHMELRKNRKAIPCYWESQPMGCLKAHCPFLHQNARPTDDASIDRSNLPSERSVTDNMLNDHQQSERKVTAVDSLVVNFEEESDNESGPTYSPVKSANRIVTVKTLEEIRLEKIQAESAAYYSYFGQTPSLQTTENPDDLRQRICDRMVMNKTLSERIVTLPHIVEQTFPVTTAVRSNKRLSDDQMATILGDDSLRKRQKIVYQNKVGNFEVMLDKRNPSTQVSVTDNTNKRIAKPKLPSSQASVADIKIKTLAEIRAEKAKNQKEDSMEVSEQEVTSTCVEENPEQNSGKKSDEHISPRRKIKLRRKPPISENNSSNCETISPSDSSEKNPIEPSSEQFETESVSSKVIDEGLLLESDEDDGDVTMKAEEELLNEIDDYLDD